MKDVVSTVVYKESLGENYFRLGFKVGYDEFSPGQFVMVEIPDGDVFLRRPFGIVKIDKGVLEICVKIVGKGTAALSQIQPGQSASVLGPLGRGFKTPHPHPLPQGERGKGEGAVAILVAGGYGIAPLLSLAKLLKDEKKEVAFYYGAKKSPDLLYMEELKTIGVDLHLTTEDGSAGEKGLITEILSPHPLPLPSGERVKGEGAIFACGPEGLLKEVARIASEAKIPAQVSLERYMACGTGVCLGCMVKSRDGTYVRACREGPVFDAADVAWQVEKT